MNILGWFLAVSGAVGIFFAVFQTTKLKKMNRVPHRRPSEIMTLGPGAADARGMLSTEGQARFGAQPLMGPMSGEPCLAYEIFIEAKWEKHVSTDSGTRRDTGSRRVFTQSNGCIFQLLDGAGGVLVDATGPLDASMEISHTSEIGLGGIQWPTRLRFGHLDTNTPIVHGDDGRIIGFVGTERIVRASPTLYALGQLKMEPSGPVLGTPKGMGTGKLVLSSKGRSSLLASTKRAMTIAYACGGVLFVAGTAMGIFAAPKAAAEPPPRPMASSAAADSTPVASEPAPQGEDARTIAQLTADFKSNSKALMGKTVTLEAVYLNSSTTGTGAGAQVSLTLVAAQGHLKPSVTCFLAEPKDPGLVQYTPVIVEGSVGEFFHEPALRKCRVVSTK